VKDIDEYQRQAGFTAVYPECGFNLVYPTLGLCGESGEFAEKVKKAIRDDGGHLTGDRKTGLAYELGDILWYVAACARELQIPLSEIIDMNLRKLQGRKERGKLGGSGDSR